MVKYVGPVYLRDLNGEMRRDIYDALPSALKEAADRGEDVIVGEYLSIPWCYKEV